MSPLTVPAQARSLVRQALGGSISTMSRRQRVVPRTTPEAEIAGHTRQSRVARRGSAAEAARTPRTVNPAPSRSIDRPASVHDEPLTERYFIDRRVRETADFFQQNPPRNLHLAEQRVTACMRHHGCDCRPRMDGPYPGSITLEERTRQLRKPFTVDVLQTLQNPDATWPDTSHITAEQWKEMLGTPDEPVFPDLALSSLSPDEFRVDRIYDVDAFIMPVKSLGAFSKNGFQISYLPRYGSNIDQNWHFSCGAEEIEPQHTKHVLIGTDLNQTYMHTYMFFPGMAVGMVDNKPVTYLNDTQMQVWTDEILLPALRSVYDSYIRASHPRSFAEVCAKTRAKVKEAKLKEEQRLSPSTLFFTLPKETEGAPALLDQLYRQISANCVAHRDDIWHRHQLVTAAFGTKKRFHAKSRAILNRQIFEMFSSQFDCQHLDIRIFVDLGYQDIPIALSGVPVTAIRKARCNLHDARSVTGIVNLGIYNFHGTSQAGSVTAEFGRSSDAVEQGLVFMQAYNAVKDALYISDRAAAPVFSQPWLNQAAFDAGALNRIQAINNPNRVASDGLAERSRTLRVLRHMIHRVHACYSAVGADSINWSVRKEMRMQIDLFDNVTRHGEAEEGPLELSPGNHWPFYVIPTAVLFDYMKADANRYLMAVVRIITRHQTGEHQVIPSDERAPQLDAALLNALLECLDLMVNGGRVLAHNRLAQSEYEVNPTAENPDGVEFGLNLVRMQQQHNSFFVPVAFVNWHNLSFRVDQLQTSGYHRRDYRLFAGNVENHRDADRFTTHVANLIASYKVYCARGLSPEDAARAQKTLFAYMSLPVYYHYSRYILKQLGKKPANGGPAALPFFEDLTASERDGRHGLNIALIKKALGKMPEQCRTRKGGGQGAKAVGGFSQFEWSWQTRLRLLFDFDDGFVRKTWDNVSFRRSVRFISGQLDEMRHGLGLAWRRSLGTGDYANFITIVPKYDAYNLRQKKKRNHDDPVGMEQPVLWVCAAPEAEPVRGTSARKTKFNIVGVADENILLSVLARNPGFFALGEMPIPKVYKVLRADEPESSDEEAEEDGVDE